MGVPGDLLLAVAGVVAVFAAPLEVAFVVLVAFWLLVPGTLPVPHGPHLVLVDRLILYAFAARLLLRGGRRGQASRGAFRLTAVHGALGVLVFVGFLDGVVLAPGGASVAGDLHAWVYMLDLALLFVVVLAVVRTIGLWPAARAVVALVMVAVAVGFIERLTGHGWSHFFFERLPANDLAPGANLLSTRGGHVRAQAASQFALEYGWVLTMLLPLTIYAAVRIARSGRRFGRLAIAMPLALMLAVVLSGSRGAEVAALVVAVLFVPIAVAGADRRFAVWIGVVGVAALGAVLVDPSLFTAPFSTGAVSDPSSVRLERLPELFSLIVHRPFIGVGLDGLAGTFGGTDDAYALLYATVGMAGLVAWGALLVTSLVSAVGALRAPRASDSRMLGGACVLGLLALACACASYDLVSTAQSEWALVVLAAFGVAATESAPRRATLPRRWSLRAVLPVLGLLVGLGIWSAAPVGVSQQLSVLTTAPYVSDEGAGIDQYGGTTLVNTLCAAITNPVVITKGTGVTCDQATNFFPLNPPALALVTVHGPTPAAVAAETHRAFATIFHFMPMAGGPTGPLLRGKPAWAVTAPLWAGSAGLLAMFLLPRRRVRRRVEPDDTDHDADDRDGTGRALTTEPAPRPVAVAAVSAGGG